MFLITHRVEQRFDDKQMLNVRQSLMCRGPIIQPIRGTNTGCGRLPYTCWHRATVLCHPRSKGDLLTAKPAEAITRKVPVLLWNLVEKLRWYLLSRPWTIQQEETNRPVGDQCRELASCQNGVAAREATQCHNRLVRRENERVSRHRAGSGDQEFRVALIGFQVVYQQGVRVGVFTSSTTCEVATETLLLRRSRR